MNLKDVAEVGLKRDIQTDFTVDLENINGVGEVKRGLWR